MLYHLSVILKNHIHALNVLHYVSFRAMGALLTSLVLSFAIGSFFIKNFKDLFKSDSRAYTPDNHRSKNGLPTMGGLFIILSVLGSTLLWCNLAEVDVWIFLLNLILFAFIGLWDDLSKIYYKKGISEKNKFLLMILFSLCVTLLWLFVSAPSTEVYFPFFKNFTINLGYFYILWAMFIIIGTSNAVNLTDGLDGLATGSLILNFGLFSTICYLAGHQVFANYLYIPYAGTAEISIIGASLLGASIGFLWYNTYPAQIFMGDVGSLSLGAALALMALMSKQEILLAVSGGLFVVEALSVILQVFYFKMYGKRIFKMAPLHHHFELIGWQEAKITIRFGIISLILCILALMTLKIR